MLKASSNCTIFPCLPLFAFFHLVINDSGPALIKAHNSISKILADLDNRFGTFHSCV